MDPFARKMILAALAFAGFMLLLAGALSVAYLHYHPRCSEQVFSEAASPDGRWKAAILERRCGEDSAFFLHVNIRPSAEPVRLEFFSGRAEGGEVFVVEEATQRSDLELAWTEGGRLAVRCANCIPALVRKQDEQWRTVTVGYELHR